MDKLAYLRKVDLFGGLSTEELKACEQSLPMSRVSKGRVLCTPSDTDEALYVIKEGAVRLYRLSRDGREVTLGTLGVGDVFGTLPIAGSISRNTFAQAESDGLVCRISEASLRELVGRHPDIALRLFRLLGERLASTEDQVEDLAFRSAEQRVARQVLRLVSENGTKVTVSHEQIAKAAGVARETVTKILGVMEQAGIVKTGYRRLKVLDRDAVSRRATD